MRGKWLGRGLVLMLAFLLAGCASTSELPPELHRIDSSVLPPADRSLNIPGLGPCTDSPDRTLHLNANQPVTVLVHGCFASAGRFRSLAQVFAFHGQQSACFSYDDRDSLTHSATQLVNALDVLAGQMHHRQMTVIGHSQGGLIARNALTAERQRPLAADIDLRLVTISSPYAGIAAADHCGSSVARVVSLGLVVPICMLVSGDKWYEITAASSFIREPGHLIGQVDDFIKIVTDERDSCRRYDGEGRCLEDDYVFSTEEQYFPAVDNSPQVVPVAVRAGHAEIVGNGGDTPDKLITILQHQRVMRATTSAEAPALESLLNTLYRDEGHSQSSSSPPRERIEP
jgi:pimeloyl-ACP methyl ester carboxylesterase